MLLLWVVVQMFQIAKVFFPYQNKKQEQLYTGNYIVSVLNNKNDKK